MGDIVTYLKFDFEENETHIQRIAVLLSNSIYIYIYIYTVNGCVHVCARVRVCVYVCVCVQFPER